MRRLAHELLFAFCVLLALPLFHLGPRVEAAYLWIGDHQTAGIAGHSSSHEEELPSTQPPSRLPPFILPIMPNQGGGDMAGTSSSELAREMAKDQPGLSVDAILTLASAMARLRQRNTPLLLHPLICHIFEPPRFL